MQRVRVGIIGAGTVVEWGILPALTGPDATAPADTGAWWTRRPSRGGEIRYQPPAWPEVVAFCDPMSGGSARRAESIAMAARVPAVYTDWRLMLREVPLDAVLLAGTDEYTAAGAPPDAGEVLRAFSVSPAAGPRRWMWIEGNGIGSLAGLSRFERAALGREVRVWWGRPLRLAAAHRTAKRLVERDAIGHVTALQGRFPLGWDEAHFGPVNEVLDLLLSFAPAGSVPLGAYVARHAEGSANLTIGFSGGFSIGALFQAADVWNTPLPRLEICGTQGRYLSCEGGRRVAHYVPREGARSWEPPGLGVHVTAANVAGVAEDLKAFLATIAGESQSSWDGGTQDMRRVLAVWEAANASLRSGIMEPVPAVHLQAVALENGKTAPALAPETNPANLTLNLG